MIPTLRTVVIFAILFFALIYMANGQIPDTIVYIVNIEYANGSEGRAECISNMQVCYLTNIQVTGANASDIISKAFSSNDSFSYNLNGEHLVTLSYTSEDRYRLVLPDTVIQSKTVGPIREWIKQDLRKTMGYK